jgi:hypothetical protein
LVPDRTLYRVRLALAEGHPAPVTRILRGQVILRGEAISLARRLWRFALAVVIRESGA